MGATKVKKKGSLEVAFKAETEQEVNKPTIVENKPDTFGIMKKCVNLEKDSDLHMTSFAVRIDEQYKQMMVMFLKLHPMKAGPLFEEFLETYWAEFAASKIKALEKGYRKNVI
jgi:hypothetical protein